MTLLSYLHVITKLWERFLSGKLCVHNLCNFEHYCKKKMMKTNYNKYEIHTEHSCLFVLHAIRGEFCHQQTFGLS